MGLRKWFDHDEGYLKITPWIEICRWKTPYKMTGIRVNETVIESKNYIHHFDDLMGMAYVNNRSREGLDLTMDTDLESLDKERLIFIIKK